MKNINKASAFASAARPFYEENAIGEELKILLEDEAKLLIGAQRRSTEEAFESGERLERIALFLPEGTVENGRSNAAATRRGTSGRGVRFTAT